MLVMIEDYIANGFEHLKAVQHLVTAALVGVIRIIDIVEGVELARVANHANIVKQSGNKHFALGLSWQLQALCQLLSNTGSALHMMAYGRVYRSHHINNQLES